MSNQNLGSWARRIVVVLTILALSTSIHIASTHMSFDQLPTSPPVEKKSSNPSSVSPSQFKLDELFGIASPAVFSSAGQSSPVPNVGDKGHSTSASINKVDGFVASEKKFVGKRTTTGEEYPIYVLGQDDTTFFPQTPQNSIIDTEEYDVVILGSGLAGTCAALYLTDNKKKVLVLEKESYLGGLATFKKDENGYKYDRGASYWTKAYNQEFMIMSHMGLSKYYTQHIIQEPIDTYFWNGTLYGGYPHDGLWDYRTLGVEVPAKYPNGTTLPVLPSSFAIFKFECLNDDADGRIPDQPFQLHQKPELDLINSQEWIRKMPERFFKRISIHGKYYREKRLWARFQEQIQKGVLNKTDPMIDVIQFLDLYSRSALGSTTEDISALGYSNFYISELQPRFTTPFGTGIAIKQMLERLKLVPEYAHFKTESAVTNMKNIPGGVEVKYTEKGVGKIVKGKFAIFASQLGFAPNIIEGLELQSPEQAQTMKKLQYAHYSVHNFAITNHPYREAYDTWVRVPDYTPHDFTDMILGRWRELHGYQKGPEDKLREYIWDYSKNPDNHGSMISIYHSQMKVNTSTVTIDNHIYSDEFSAKAAESAWNRFEDIFNRGHALKQQFKIRDVYTNRYPYSVHVPEPGHFTIRSKKMSKTFGNIIIGNNNLGTPSFEEALFRGHCAANKILWRLNPKTFVQQSWSKCQFKW